MQRVSKTYRKSMEESLRNNSYIMVSFGVFNQEAQASAAVDNGDFAYFSNKNNVLSQIGSDLVYATLEENFTRVDGSMIFLPRESLAKNYYDTGIIGKDLVSDSIYDLKISFNTDPLDVKGVSVNFGENYPVNFDLISDTGEVVEIRNNDTGDWSCEDVFKSVLSITLRFYRMKNEQSRVRVYSIKFGYGLVYYNDSVMDSTLESYVSPIGADVPQIDFSITLKNYDKYFNVDNPDSAINFLETGQEMDISYGYELPDGTVEWVKGNHLWCSEWESDDYTATIRCHDIFRQMDSEYYKGTYYRNGISYYELATKVLADAGETNYYIDSRLKKLYTTNPLPRVKHKEALQIIANACRCVLTQTRDGMIQIKSNFKPEVSISGSEGTKYSNIQNVLEYSDKDEYASLNPNYTTVDGAMFFLPRNKEGILHTGYVSAALSDENGEFTENPVITLVQEAATMYYGASLVFGSSLPGGMIFRSYLNDELIEEYEYDGNITKNTYVEHEFMDFDKMEVEFTSTQYPNNRIVLNYFSFGDDTNFTMKIKDMMSSPKARKHELVKEIIVPTYSYKESTRQETLTSEDITFSKGDKITFYVGEASHGFGVLVDESTNGASIVESGAYYVTVQFSISGTHRVDITGYRYLITERYSTIVLNYRGRTIKWENPLMSDITMADDLAEWLADYYRSPIEYEYDHRGFPEIDVNDIIYQENEFVENMKVNVYQQKLKYNQGFSGSLMARRTGG